jgi:serine phosphatase RsbU (regulator of sigma subunit)
MQTGFDCGESLRVIRTIHDEGIRPGICPLVLCPDLAEQAAALGQCYLQRSGELEMAGPLQCLYFPQQPPQLAGLDMAFLYEPARQVGGDILDLIPLPEDNVLVFLGDVMGHGVEAAVLMAAVRLALHTALRETTEPALVLEEISRALYDLIQERFVTAACARLEPAARRAELASAGHPPPFHFEARSGEVGRHGGSGLPLGVERNGTYTPYCCRLGAGDCLIFVTDGVTEARDPQREFYGDERLADLIRRHGQGSTLHLLDTIREDLEAYSQQAAWKDDVTALVVQVTGL